MPHFFVDRSLGRRRVPDALRAAGFELSTLAEVYGIPADEDVSDVEWLTLAGHRDWPVLMKDNRIRYRAAEKSALTERGVVALCMSGGSLRATEMAEQFLAVKPHVFARAAEPGPAPFVVTAQGMRRVPLE